MGFLAGGAQHTVPSAAITCELPGGRNEICYLGAERSQEVGATDPRAWCFRESLLSRRMLMFGPEQLMFRCCECMEFEDGKHRPLGDKNEWRTSSIPKDWTLRADVLRAWYEIANEYTKREFFDPHDNCAALSGVAQKFQDALRDGDVRPRYLAGLWESDMVRGLLWRSSTLVDADQEPLRKSIGVSQANQGHEFMTAPTWSWLGLRGHIIQDIGVVYNPIMLDPTAYRCFPEKNPKF
ncbi:hypothetical protein GGR57DRAFT_517678 [Xylariaceae sp. FL1272]|nr:hypothetical protein GGR57DRAFT_517678 [Xylariaceae sp. FL1272]